MITDHDRADLMVFPLPVRRDLLVGKNPTEQREFATDLIRDYAYEVSEGLNLTIAGPARPVEWPEEWGQSASGDYQLWEAPFAWLRFPDREDR